MNQSHGGREGKEDQAETRPQQAGEAETTRFGMEEGDNTDIPSPTPDDAQE